MKLSRRKLITQSAVFSGASVLASQFPPIETVAKYMLRNFFRQAHASEPSSRFYFAVHFAGAPTRWIFDHFIQTSTSDSIESNKMVATALTSNGSAYTGSSLQTIEYKGMRVPYLWGGQVAAAGGGKRPMKDLLDHLITIRGFGTGVDGHSNNFRRQTQPIPSLGSTTGYLAEQSKSLLKAAQLPVMETGYSSPAGVGITPMFDMYTTPAANLAKTLMMPFSSREDAKDLQNLRNRYARTMEASSRLLKHAEFSEDSRFVGVDNESALRMIKAGISDLDQVWTDLFNKYKDIFLRTLKDRTVAGLTDQPVIATDDGTADNSGSMAAQSTTGQLDGVPAPDQDLRDWYNTVDVTGLAQGFALAEYIFTNQLCNGFEWNFADYHINNLTGRFIRKRTLEPIVDGDQARNFYLFHDQHATGHFGTVFSNGQIFRAYAAGLLELMDRLKATNVEGSPLFDRMVIHTISDFGRIPRSTGGGSDHGFDNMVTSLITGMQKSGPINIGNILRSATGYYSTIGYTGTFGYKAPTSVNGTNVTLSPTHVASTIAQLLDLQKNIWRNQAEPLAEFIAGKIKVNAGGSII